MIGIFAFFFKFSRVKFEWKVYYTNSIKEDRERESSLKK